MLRAVKFRNFKSLKDFSVTLRQVNVLVGPNNAGKSTILDGFRILAVALGIGRRRKPTIISIGGTAKLGWEFGEPIANLACKRALGLRSNGNLDRVRIRPREQATH